jgi:hypothetical protein
MPCRLSVETVAIYENLGHTTLLFREIFIPTSIICARGSHLVGWPHIWIYSNILHILVNTVFRNVRWRATHLERRKQMCKLVRYVKPNPRLPTAQQNLCSTRHLYLYSQGQLPLSLRNLWLFVSLLVSASSLVFAPSRISKNSVYQITSVQSANNFSKSYIP